MVAFFAVLGIACGWLWAVVGIVKKSKLLNSIVWQCFLISALASLGRLTSCSGGRPNTCFPRLHRAMLQVGRLSRVFRMPGKDYLILLIVCAVMGVVPRPVHRRAADGDPSVIYAAVSLIAHLHP